MSVDLDELERLEKAVGENPCRRVPHPFGEGWAPMPAGDAYGLALRNSAPALISLAREALEMREKRMTHCTGGERMRAAEEVAREIAENLFVQGSIVSTGDAPDRCIEYAITKITALIARERNPWRPISEAPRDGRTTVDLLYPYPRGRAVNCFWVDDGTFGPGWYWREPAWEGGELLPEDQWSLVCYPNMQPTHWMREPPAPEGT
jgi:hypothetical protein